MIHLFNFRPFDAKNPYLSPVSVNRELHKEGSDRSCMHLEFDITGSKLRYVLPIDLLLSVETERMLRYLAMAMTPTRS